MKNTANLSLSVSLAVALAIAACHQSPSSATSSIDEAANVPTGTDTVSTALADGQALAKATGAILLGNLTTALAELGPEGAIGFCNIRAHPLTDSMAQVLKADIRRVSDKPRNPANKANASELTYIRQLKEGLAEGESPAGLIVDMEGKQTGYYPIMTNALCLVCHGHPGRDIAQPTLNKLHTLYPDDQATGYAADEVRGLWVVTFGQPAR